MQTEEKKINLLMVDDEKDLLLSLSKMLKNRDFDITTATDGKHAIKEAKKGKFDLAILDMKMPGMNGIELLQILKKKFEHDKKRMEELQMLSMGTSPIGILKVCC